MKNNFRETMHNSLSKRCVDAILFDMDGTLLSSLAAAERIWSDWAHEHAIDAAELLKCLHGVRAKDTVQRFATPGMDIAHEVERITNREIDECDGVEPIDGIDIFLESVPPDRWAIVTSASRALAASRLKAAHIRPPKVLITAEDVTRGKPHPEGFQLAAKTLNFPAENCLIFEDAPAGILAAERSGAEVVVVAATHAHSVKTHHTSIKDFTSLTCHQDPSGKLVITRKTDI